MSVVRVISPRASLIDTVARELGTNWSDWSGSLVIFPGRRPAHFLNKHLAEQTKSSFIPPRIQSIDDLIDSLASEILGQKKKIEAVDAVGLLFGIHRQMDTRVGKETYSSLDSFLPLGIKLFAELEEVALADVSERGLREALLAFEFPKFRSLWDYYQRFYAEIERKGLSTRSTRYQGVAERVAEMGWESYKKIILAGFYAFTGIERKILAHLRTLENMVMIFQEGVGLKRQLEALHIDDGDIHRDGEDAQPGPVIHFTKAPDTHGQVFAFAAGLRGRIERGDRPDRRSVVVLPQSESLFPVLHGALSLLGRDEFNIAMGYPLSRTPLYGFLSSLMELVMRSVNAKFSTTAYLRFVLHPYTKNIRFQVYDPIGSTDGSTDPSVRRKAGRGKSNVTRIMFHRLEEYLADEKPRVLFALEELETDDALFAEIVKSLRNAGEEARAADLMRHMKTIHDNTIRNFQKFSTVGDFARQAIQVLTFVFDHSTANLHPYFRSYAEKSIELLDDVASSLLSGQRFTELSGYFTFLRHCFEGATVPFPGTPLRGLQVLGLLETRNIQFDTVYVLDANDDMIPGKPSHGVLLPQQVRQKLGLETHHDRDILKEYYFMLALNGAREVHLFYTDDEIRGKERSQFVEKLLWKMEQQRGKAGLEEFERSASYRVNLVNPKPDAVPKTPAMIEFLKRKNKFSARQLDTYLACPLKFYYMTVLGLEEKAEVSEEVEAMEVGALVHDILRDFYLPTVGQQLKKEDFSEDRLQQVIDKRFEETYGRDLIGPSYFLKEQVTAQLRRFLLEYQISKLDKEPVTIQGVELKLEAAKGDYTFAGRIDRVEERGGKTYILDYKTSADDTYVRISSDKLDVDDRKTWGKAIKSFQLPMYMLLYSEHKKKEIKDLTPAYLFLGRNILGESIEKGLVEDHAGVAELYETLERVMFKLIDEIVDPQEPFRPTEELDKQCPKCPFNVICGTQWTKELRD